MDKMDQRQRLLLIIALSFGFITVLQLFFGKPDTTVTAVGADGGVAVVEAPAAASGDAGAAVAAVAPTDPALAAGDGGTAAVVAAAGTPEPVKQLPLREVERTRKDMNLRFSSEGGTLISAQLTGPRERDQQKISIVEGYQKLIGKKFSPPPQMDMAVPAKGAPGPMAVSVAGKVPADLRYELVEDTDTAITWRATVGGFEVQKRYTWEPAGFGLALDVSLKNVSGNPQSGDLALQLARQIDPKSEEKSSLFGGIGNEASTHCLTADKLKTNKPTEDPIEVERGPLHMAGIDQQYFLAAVYPLEAREGSCAAATTPTQRSVTLAVPFSLKADEVAQFKFGAFLGPKDFELLKVTGHGLEQTVDFGWWAVICKVLLTVLQFFHTAVGNWGVAIILLTVSVKVLLLPLTHKAMVSAEAMKRLQPKMEEIKKKYPDDRERQNVEVMKLYQEAKVNPLGGCLPLLLQLPIWAALFTTLRTSYDLYGEPFFGPVWTDLTFKDPTYLLPLALGVTMIITQRLQPQMMDKQQAFIFTWIMPVFFTGLMMNYPCGLSLYIFTNNLLSIIQQFLLRKYLEKKGIAAPRTPPASGGGGGKGKLKESAS